MVKVHCYSRVNKNQVHQISALAMSGHQLESLPWASCCLEERAHGLSCRSSCVLETRKLTQLVYRRCASACHISAQWELTPYGENSLITTTFSLKLSTFLASSSLRELHTELHENFCVPVRTTWSIVCVQLRVNGECWQQSGTERVCLSFP